MENYTGYLGNCPGGENEACQYGYSPAQVVSLEPLVGGFGDKLVE